MHSARTFNEMDVAASFAWIRTTHAVGGVPLGPSINVVNDGEPEAPISYPPEIAVMPVAHVTVVVRVPPALRLAARLLTVDHDAPTSGFGPVAPVTPVAP